MHLAYDGESLSRHVTVTPHGVTHNNLDSNIRKNPTVSILDIKNIPARILTRCTLFKHDWVKIGAQLDTPFRQITNDTLIQAGNSVTLPQPTQ